jgi:hypothetical protein
MGRACSRIGEKRNAYMILVGKQEGKRSLGKLIRMWVNNIKMHLTEIGWSDIDLISLSQDRDQWVALINTVINLRVP